MWSSSVVDNDVNTDVHLYRYLSIINIIIIIIVSHTAVDIWSAGVILLSLPAIGNEVMIVTGYCTHHTLLQLLYTLVIP